MADIVEMVDADPVHKKECECCTTRMGKIVCCAYCGYHACMKCIATFITSQINDASCMACHKTYTHDFINENFTQEMIRKTIPSHRKKVLFELEKAMLPQTMPYLEHIQQVPALQEEHAQITRYLNELRDRKAVIDQQLDYARALRNGRVPQQQPDHGDEKSTEQIQRAPVSCPGQECRGFLNTKGKCGVCGIVCCQDCHEQIIPNEPNEEQNTHICNPDILETVRTLDRECRKCPSCAIPIYRIDGCDQMWCVKCHTAFNWRTGKVESGRVHNPHYFEYLRQHAPDQLAEDARYANGVQPCQHRLIENQVIQRFLNLPTPPYRQVFQKWTKQFISLLRRVRKSNHLDASSSTDMGYVYRMLRSTPDHIRYVNNFHLLPVAFDASSNIDLRLQYLLKEISQEEFQSSLLRRQKCNAKLIEYRQVVDTFIQVWQEQIGLATQVLATAGEEQFDSIFENLYNQLTQVEQFTNSAIARLNRLHGGRKVKQIGE